MIMCWLKVLRIVCRNGCRMFEAHSIIWPYSFTICKYMDGVKADGLSEAIVNAARLMRHDGVRLVVSTQSPKALAPELLELVTIACLHHFHSPDWWSYLQSKLPLNQDAFERILSLNSGEAVAFATSHNLSVSNIEGSHCLPIRIRPRITEDLGSSRRNS